MTLLETKDLTVTTDSGHVLLDAVNLHIGRGDKVGLIGESGSGKSLTALSLMGLLPSNLQATGTITLTDDDDHATNLISAPEKLLCSLRGRKISMVFQEPMTALNPLMTVGHQVAEVISKHGTLPSKKSARIHTRELFHAVGLADPQGIAAAYPHQLSGGQRQRVLIAMAVANDPSLIICDEPTTALDVAVQKQITTLINRLVDVHNAGLLFITHDLGLVSQVCNRLYVLKDGKIVESGETKKLLFTPEHPYTLGLKAASDLSARDKNGHLFTVESAPGHYIPGVQQAPPPLPAVSQESDQLAPVLAADNLTKIYGRRRSLFGTLSRQAVTAVDSVSLTVAPGQRVGLVGGSGSGKTTVLTLLAGLVRPTSGSLTIAGSSTITAKSSAKELSIMRQRIGEHLQIIFQDPMGSLDPRRTIGDSVMEPMLNPAAGFYNRHDRLARAAYVLEKVGIDPGSLDRYPHEFSGGERQRISIARAITVKPKILLADECVSALDVSVRAQVLNLLTDLIAEYGMAMVFVSHDLSVVRQMCTNVMVLHQGKVVEHGLVEEIWTNPRDPYTQELLSAIPHLPTM